MMGTFKVDSVFRGWEDAEDAEEFRRIGLCRDGRCVYLRLTKDVKILQAGYHIGGVLFEIPRTEDIDLSDVLEDLKASW